MIFLYVILALFLLIFLLCMINVRITLEYNEKAVLKIGALFIDYKVGGAKKKKKPEKDKKKKVVAESVSQPTQPKKEKSKIMQVISEFTEDFEFADFYDFVVSFVSQLIKVFNKHLKVRFKRFNVTVGSDDPSDTAIRFGAVSQACAYLFELLDNNTKLYPLKRSNVYVNSDFDRKNIYCNLKLIIRLRIVHILIYIVKVFFEFIKIKESKSNKPKGNKK